MNKLTKYEKETIILFSEGEDIAHIQTYNAGLRNRSFHAETLIHSDRGAHYTSVKFIQLLKDSDLRQSMSRKANCWDNAPQESFFGHMKDEINLSECETFDDIFRTISDWADYYNHDRYQWDLAKLAPCEYYRYLTAGIYPLSIPKPKGQT